jgi:hypothetical protein
MLGQSCPPVSSFPLCVASSRFSRTGGSAAADSDFVFYVSNLSWNTNDETLRVVRLFGSAWVYDVPDSELPPL